MIKFETKVQYLKHRVFSEVAKAAFDDKLMQRFMDIPKTIVPGNKPTMRCCVYKERAILGERVMLAMGGDKRLKPMLEVIGIACDECPAAGYEVSPACRACLTHLCSESCPADAIYFDERKRAHIDKSKCVECGRCAKACPFGSIKNSKRPCMEACKADAINMDEDKVAVINADKCTNCGACSFQCPFGAIMDKSHLLDVINMLEYAKANPSACLTAIVAPSIAGQFGYAKPGQVLAGLRELGFTRIAEAALGADMVAREEAEELAQKGMLFSSCCPAFVDYVEKFYPDLTKYISHNLSPMATIAKAIKSGDPRVKTVFIGPCIAKKGEADLPRVKGWVDSVITFEELQALFESRGIDLTTLAEEQTDQASPYGRGFARSGGLAGAMREGLKEIGHEDFVFRPLALNGMAEFKMALLKAQKGIADFNFLEGMACAGGCVGGPASLTHDLRSFSKVDAHAKAAEKKTIMAAVDAWEGKTERV